MSVVVLDHGLQVCILAAQPSANFWCASMLPTALQGVGSIAAESELHCPPPLQAWCRGWSGAQQVLAAAVALASATRWTPPSCSRRRQSCCACTQALAQSAPRGRGGVRTQGSPPAAGEGCCSSTSCRGFMLSLLSPAGAASLQCMSQRAPACCCSPSPMFFPVPPACIAEIALTLTADQLTATPPASAG